MKLLATLILAVAIQTDGTDTVAGFSSYLRGERWEFSVTRAMLAQAPAWEDADLSPPLPIRRAMAIAATQLGELVSDVDRWRFSAIALRPVGESGWVYVVDYNEPPPRPDGGITARLSLVVLMNGTTIVPTRTPWPPR